MWWCLYRMTFPAISKDFLGKFCFLLRQGQKKWAWCYVNLPPGQDLRENGSLSADSRKTSRPPSVPGFSPTYLGCSAPASAHREALDLKDCLGRSQILCPQPPHQQNGNANTHHIYLPELRRGKWANDWKPFEKCGTLCHLHSLLRPRSKVRMSTNTQPATTIITSQKRFLNSWWEMIVKTLKFLIVKYKLLLRLCKINFY